MIRLGAGYALILFAGLLLGFEGATALARVGFLSGASAVVGPRVLGWADALWVGAALALAAAGYGLLRGRNPKLPPRRGRGEG